MACTRANEEEREYNRGLARRLRKAVAESPLPRKEIAYRVDSSLSAMDRWTSDVDPCGPRPYRLALLCEVLGVDANEMLGVRR